MNIYFRILLAVYACCSVVLSFITMVITVRQDVFDNIYDYLRYDVLENPKAKLAIFIVSSIFFIASLIFLISGLKSNKDKKAVSKHTNIGEIKISLNTIENIALAASRKLNGIRETKAYVTRFDNKVNITIKSIVLPDINIPGLSEDIQVRVKKSVEDSTGVNVNEVKVMVENVYTGYKSRVE